MGRNATVGAHATSPDENEPEGAATTPTAQVKKRPAGAAHPLVPTGGEAPIHGGASGAGGSASSSRDVRPRLQPEAPWQAAFGSAISGAGARTRSIGRDKRPWDSGASVGDGAKLRRTAGDPAAPVGAGQHEGAALQDFDDPEGVQLSEDSEVAGWCDAVHMPRVGSPSPPRSVSRSRSPVPQPAADDAPRARPAGRRRVATQADPVDAQDAMGHTLVMTGPIIWCARCGRYAALRVGRALRAQCVGVATGAYATRLARLRSGRHPLTGASLMPG